jgi:hypothetical protein
MEGHPAFGKLFGQPRRKLPTALDRSGYRAPHLNVGGWLSQPHRLSARNPAILGKEDGEKNMTNMPGSFSFPSSSFP